MAYRPSKTSTRAERFFWAITAHPKIVLVVSILLALAPAFYLPSLTKDTRADAFMPADHPAVLYRNTVKEVFGLHDPMVLAVVKNGPEGVFNPHTLELVTWLTEQVADVQGIDPDRVRSIATENNIVGTADGMIVEPFFEAPPNSQPEADRIRAAVMDFPLYVGSLVSDDGTMTLIVAELLNDRDSEATYQALVKLASSAPITAGETLHVAGQGALSGYLGSYIDDDARRLTPLAAIVIALVLFAAYRTARGVAIPAFVAAGTMVAALGAMAATGAAFYIITNALPVILIGIAVADSIHIMGQYYGERAAQPNALQRELVVRTMVAMWRPVTITSATTMAGFMGISLASLMPPMEEFGLFATLGIGVALILSLVTVPAGLALLSPRGSPAFEPVPAIGQTAVRDYMAQLMARLGGAVLNRPVLILIVSGLVVAVGALGALRLEVNDADIENFQHEEDIYRAEQAINARTDGTNYLDIVVEAAEPDGLLEPNRLKRIAALQTYLEGLPHVNGTTSIVDYLKQMNRAVHENRADAYALPADADAVAQYLLLYSMGGDPTDFEDEIDSEYRMANIRVTMDSGLYSDARIVVEAAQRYIADRLQGSDLTATVSGRVAVYYYWMRDLAQSHVHSVLISLIAVWLMAAASFRSLVAGLFTMAPVAFSVFLIYAVMGATGTWLAIGTSMSAAIAIGIGVDFSVHTLDRLIVMVRDRKQKLDDALMALFPSTGRALFFNFATVFLGFGVLVTSQVPGLVRFGLLVAVAVSASFLASMTLLPALVKIARPGFLGLEPDRPEEVPASARTQTDDSHHRALKR